MNTCLNLANANLASRVKKPTLKLDFANNLAFIKKSGFTIFLDFDNFAKKFI